MKTLDILRRLEDAPTDREAIALLSEQLFRLARQVGKSFPELAHEDVAQQVLLSIFLKSQARACVSAIREDADGWLRTCVRNRFRSEHRKTKRSATASLEALAETGPRSLPGEAPQQELGLLAQAEERVVLAMVGYAREGRQPRYREGFDRDWAQALRLAQGDSMDDLLADEGLPRGARDPEHTKARNRVYKNQERLRSALLEAADALAQDGTFSRLEHEQARRFLTHLVRCQRTGAPRLSPSKEAR